MVIFLKETVVTNMIQNLSKVAVSLRAGDRENDYNLTSGSVDFNFIYGAGSGGLCGLESALYEKGEGDKISLTVQAAGASEIFGHLRMPIYCALGIRKQADPVFLEVTVTGVSEADSRELIQSIARGVSHSCGGGSCDGGCG